MLGEALEVFEEVCILLLLLLLFRGGGHLCLVVFFQAALIDDFGLGFSLVLFVGGPSRFIVFDLLPVRHYHATEWRFRAANSDIIFL